MEACIRCPSLARQASILTKAQKSASEGRSFILPDGIAPWSGRLANALPRFGMPRGLSGLDYLVDRLDTRLDHVLRRTGVVKESNLASVDADVLVERGKDLLELDGTLDCVLGVFIR